MAMGIIDLLELVDIHHNDAVLLVIAPAPHMVGQVFVELSPVVQVGQIVGPKALTLDEQVYDENRKCSSDPAESNTIYQYRKDAGDYSRYGKDNHRQEMVGTDPLPVDDYHNESDRKHRKAHQNIGVEQRAPMVAVVFIKVEQMMGQSVDDYQGRACEYHWFYYFFEFFKLFFVPEDIEHDIKEPDISQYRHSDKGYGRKHLVLQIADLTRSVFKCPGCCITNTQNYIRINH